MRNFVLLLGLYFVVDFSTFISHITVDVLLILYYLILILYDFYSMIVLI